MKLLKGGKKGSVKSLIFPGLRKNFAIAGENGYHIITCVHLSPKVLNVSEVFNAASLEWQPVRPDLSCGVSGKTILEDGVRISLTRIAIGGRFGMHRDNYEHLFYFLSGEGLIWVQDKQFKVTPGLVVRVTAGEPHAYENTGNQDLVLISVNMATQ